MRLRPSPCARRLAPDPWSVRLGCLAALVVLVEAGCTDGRSVVGARERGVSRNSDAGRSLGRAFVDLTETLQAAPFPIFPGVVPVPPQPTVGAFADVDGDGRPEILLASLHNPEMFASSPNPLTAFRYDPVNEALSQLPPLLPTDGSSLAGMLDFDGDGHPDSISWQWGRGLDVAWGNSSGFDPRTHLLEGLNAEGEMNLYPDDLDGDGWLDMLVARRCGSPDCKIMVPVLRVALRRFEIREDLVPMSIPAMPCAAFSAEFVPGERTLMAVVGDNPGSPQPTMFYRPSQARADGLRSFEPFDPIGFFLLSPMAVTAGDVDGDGLFDLAVAVNPVVRLFTAQPGRRFIFHEDALDPAAADLGRAMIPWGVALLDVDRDGRPDLVSVHGDDGSSFGTPGYYIGPQHVTIRLNLGGYQFADVTAGTGVERRGQWRALSVGDLDLDGAPDLIAGGMGEVPRVYHNVLDNGGHGFALRLHGTTSNHLGTGARVRVFVHAHDAPQHYLAGSVGSPFLSPEPLVFVGLGPATAAERLEITWPSGTVQEIADVDAGRMHDIDEPPVLTIEPTGRHLPADGASQARIRITPRRPDGTVADAARVEVVSVAGGGVVSEAVRDPQGWTATLTAPAAPGSTVVEARIDGTPVRIRPRIWWDAR